jgi:hypothetical protein
MVEEREFSSLTGRVQAVNFSRPAETDSYIAILDREQSRQSVFQLYSAAKSRVPVQRVPVVLLDCCATTVPVCVPVFIIAVSCCLLCRFPDDPCPLPPFPCTPSPLLCRSMRDVFSLLHFPVTSVADK